MGSGALRRRGPRGAAEASCSDLTWYCRTAIAYAVRCLVLKSPMLCDARYKDARAQYCDGVWCDLPQYAMCGTESTFAATCYHACYAILVLTYADTSVFREAYLLYDDQSSHSVWCYLLHSIGIAYTAVGCVTCSTDIAYGATSVWRGLRSSGSMLGMPCAISLWAYYAIIGTDPGYALHYLPARVPCHARH
eukprot:3941961-Rhodomonas_salina.10